MRSIVIALLAFQLGHVSAPVVVLPAPPIVVPAPPPLTKPPIQRGRLIPCTCNNPCGYCGSDAPGHLYFEPTP